ncbi:MAG: hypothetical protein M1114_05465 [Candidatus Dependentiae bacterium]|nr:hypothetical protein [Candidatus Dependentiae bacterium]
MKKLFALLFFALCSTTYAMDLLIQMPNSEILTDRLQNAHFGHFVKNTEIIKQLANQEKHLSEVVEAINIAVDTYCQKIQHPAVIAVMHVLRPKIIKIILKDYPEAIRRLKITSQL